jgi:hypothetical protein
VRQARLLEVSSSLNQVKRSSCRGQGPLYEKQARSLKYSAKKNEKKKAEKKKKGVKSVLIVNNRKGVA